ncbi:MAG TPA: class I SAM-dependent methyltransferase [Bryobacteraceae bacterium]|nr:class I SAM-dependent methyltransferase [Bryobacteraceae bacterium]
MRVLCTGIQCCFLVVGFAVASMAQEPRISDFKNDLAPYVGSPQHAVDRMLAMANLKPGETLYDLGCGDGRILITAAQRYKIKAVGVEISERLAREAASKVRKQGLQNSIRIIHGNLLETDLSKADVVTLYLNNSANESLRPNLERYLRPHTRVVSYDYPIPGWKPIDTSDTEGHNGDTHTIYLYEVPNSITKK